MRNYLTFNGVDSTAYGVYISGQGTFSAPQKEVNFINVPGRNGDLIGKSDKFRNLELTYPAFIYTNFKNNIRDFRNFLNSINGYAVLRDTYHTDEFRLAAYVSEFEPEVVTKNDAGSFDIVFNCKPQRFLDSGTVQTTYTANSFTINNPTLFNAKPKIEAVIANSGTYGQIVIGGETITINVVNTTVVIDSEMQDCYNGTTSYNDAVVFSDNNFPVLKPGANAITKTSNVTLKITPNWWRV
jgi:phage-related protein